MIEITKFDKESASTSIPESNLRGYKSSCGGHFAGLMHGDSAVMLRSLPNDVFNVAITSPPYYWVRDYGFDGQIGHEESVEAYIHTALLLGTRLWF